MNPVEALMKEYKEIIKGLESQINQLELRLGLSRRMEVKLCGDHHGKGYEDVNCILCDFERRNRKGG